jgi:polynucleotide 5'-hydroxyl-kinase GRC3/NOL9
VKVSIDISGGRSARVRGPARISIVDGECYVAGARLSKGSQVVVSSYKSLAIYARSDAKVDVELGEGGGVDVARPEDEPLLEWVDAAGRIASKGSTIVVIGPTESGKTTFTTLLANTAIEKGLRPCIVDADIGQEDIGPPGFIALSCPSRQFVWLRDLEPMSMRFVGYNAPSMGASRLIASIADLASRGSSIGDLVVINTDGWVSLPQAIEMKLDIARFVRATHIVALAGGSYIGSISRKGVGEMIILRSPQGIRTRTREERRILRSQAYRKAFEGSTMRSLNISDIMIIGSCLLTGTPLPKEEISQISEILGVNILYATSLEETIYALVEGSRDVDRPIKLRDGREVIQIPRGGEKGLLCSVISREGNEYPCILDSVDPISNRINIVTKYQGEAVAIAIGRIKVDEAYEDSWRGSRCPI